MTDETSKIHFRAIRSVDMISSINFLSFLVVNMHRLQHWLALSMLYLVLGQWGPQHWVFGCLRSLNISAATLGYLAV